MTLGAMIPAMIPGVMIRGAMILAATGLTGCGVDGPPIRPALNANIGIGQTGVHSAAQVSATRGNVTVGLGL